MKLKQALVLGLTTAVLAIPAFAADNATSQPSSVTMEPQAVAPAHAKNGAVHTKKGPQTGLTTDGKDAKKMGQQADLNQLSTVNPA